MLVPSPRTWTNTEFVDDTKMNTVRDALLFLLDPPQCQAYNTTAPSIASNAVTPQAVTLDVETYDNDNIHSTGGSTNRFTIVTPGTYEVNAQVVFAANSTGMREVRTVKNGSTPPLGRVVVTPGAQVCVAQISGVLMPFSAGDTLDLMALQNSGAALALVAGSGLNSFMRVQRVCA